ncbi:hypothetical protein RFI_35545 [Reticulomyxa filosa]|uniref:Uncharacterized protein n=1 Tax=Reticulomyxa filosa TaxID=46433 RepID=X6LJY5_RETFI|nr:hypothetical protein RFI_35545 [Reticulomyxa filosa]|eukprot:ETO01894.1 hypothetical protein RFI_35545 [Reticulomyxa filosa]
MSSAPQSNDATLPTNEQIMIMSQETLRQQLAELCEVVKDNESVVSSRLRLSAHCKILKANGNKMENDNTKLLTESQYVHNLENDAKDNLNLASVLNADSDDEISLRRQLSTLQKQITKLDYSLKEKVSLMRHQHVDIGVSSSMELDAPYGIPILSERPYIGRSMNGNEDQEIACGDDNTLRLAM